MFESQTLTFLTKSDGMKQEIFLKFIRKVHKIYVLLCFMWQKFVDHVISFPLQLMYLFTGS